MLLAAISKAFRMLSDIAAILGLDLDEIQRSRLLFSKTEIFKLRHKLSSRNRELLRVVGCLSSLKYG